MKRIVFAPFTFLLLSCSSPISQDPDQTSTPDAKATLISLTPSLEITFDGDECKVHSPKEIPLGEHGLVFNDRSDLSAYPVP